MRFLLIDDIRKQNAINFILATNTNSGYCVEVRPYKKRRSLLQNNTAHMWLDVIDKERGEVEDTTKKEIKESLGLFTIEEFKGCQYRQWISTKDLTVKQMIEFMEAIEIVANSLNILLPYPDDIKYLYGDN